MLVCSCIYYDDKGTDVTTNLPVLSVANVTGLEGNVGIGGGGGGGGVTWHGYIVVPTKERHADPSQHIHCGCSLFLVDAFQTCGLNSEWTVEYIMHADSCIGDRQMQAPNA